MKLITFIFICSLPLLIESRNSHPLTKKITQIQDNIALGARAVQSSTAFGGDAKRATDGNINSHYFNGQSCTHTNNARQSWLVIDLGHVYNVDQVKLFNRQDCCSERLQQFTVSVSYVSTPQFAGDSLQPVNAQQCSYQHPPVGSDASVSCNGKMGRYVMIAKHGILTLCEVEVSEIGYTNIALGARAVQSSIAHDGYANLATDGNINSNYFAKSCTHTKNMRQSWLVIDLGKVHNVNQVKLYNRQDCCAQRLQKFTVSVSYASTPRFVENHLQPINAQQCSYQHNPVGRDISISCNGKMGRYIMIAKDGILTLCEVEVSGYANINNNVALGACAKQSSIAYDGEANRAVDGNTNSNWNGRSCTHTNNEKQSWLVIDLGQIYSVNRVKLYNRQDCCSDRLQQFTVSVSYSRKPRFAGNNIQPINAQQCAYQHSAVGREATISCNEKMGKYIVIAKDGVLTLCEVEVFGVAHNNDLWGIEEKQDSENLVD